MDIRHLVGQRLCTGFSGTQLDVDFIQTVRENKIGNVILFGHNIRGLEQLHRLCAEIQTLVMESTGYPAFIAIDQEGGPVTRLPEGAAVFPSAMAIAATGDPHNAYQAGLMTGEELMALGVTMNLAPVMDINTNPNNPVIGVRSFGGTPDVVGAYGAQMIRGFTDAGVLCVAKHFPGHGDTAVDSHIGLPCVDKTLEALFDAELLPFQAAIAAGVPAIMASHILYPKLEAEHVPATMSRQIITGLLKERLGFSGLVLSDCMMMGAIAGHYGTVSGCLYAAQAGVDVIFVSHSAALAGEAASCMRDALANGRLNLMEMEASVCKILAYKQKIQPQPAPSFTVASFAAHTTIAQRMAEEAATWVKPPEAGVFPLGDRPLFVGCPPYRANNASDPMNASLTFPTYLAGALDGQGISTSPDPNETEIHAVLESVAGHSSIVLGTINAHLHKGQMQLLHKLAQTGKPMACVALRNPYDLRDLPSHVSALAVYGCDALSLAAAAGVLSGRIPAGGRLPVKL